MARGPRQYKRNLKTAVEKGYIPPDGRVGHIYYDRINMVYDKGANKKAGLMPVYLKLEDTGDSVFVCLVRWQRRPDGLTVIDQRDMYSFPGEEGDE